MASKFPPRMAPECLNIYSGAFKKMYHLAGKVDWIRSGDFPKRNTPNIWRRLIVTFTIMVSQSPSVEIALN